MADHYRIVIRGLPAEHHLEHYRDEFEISRKDRCTLLSGPIRDPAQLHGIVVHLTSVGLELIEVTSTNGPAPEPAS